MNVPKEYYVDMGDECMRKHKHYLNLAHRIPEHQHFLMEVAALFYFAAHAFRNFPECPHESRKAALDEIRWYIVKTELAEFVNACHFVICYSVEEPVIADWGFTDIRADLLKKYSAVVGLSREFSVSGNVDIDVRTCDVDTLRYLITVAKQFANRDGCGFFDVK